MAGIYQIPSFLRILRDGMESLNRGKLCAAYGICVAAEPPDAPGGIMNSLNSILVEGNLVKDPNTRTLPSGNQICAFTLATNRYYKNGNQAFEDEVSYFDVEAWSRLGTTCAQYLKKGKGVRVVGRLKQDRWTDPEGKQRTKVKIVAEHVEFKPQKKDQAEANKESDPVQEVSREEVQDEVEFEETGQAAVF